MEHTSLSKGFQDRTQEREREREGKKLGLQEVEREGKGRREEGTLQ